MLSTDVSGGSILMGNIYMLHLMSCLAVWKQRGWCLSGAVGISMQCPKHPSLLLCGGQDFMGYKSRLTVHISGFPMFSFLSPVENFFCKIFLSTFLPYCLTMESVLTGMLG